MGLPILLTNGLLDFGVNLSGRINGNRQSLDSDCTPELPFTAFCIAREPFGDSSALVPKVSISTTTFGGFVFDRLKLCSARNSPDCLTFGEDVFGWLVVRNKVQRQTCVTRFSTINAVPYLCRDMAFVKGFFEELESIAADKVAGTRLQKQGGGSVIPADLGS